MNTSFATAAGFSSSNVRESSTTTTCFSLFDVSCRCFGKTILSVGGQPISEWKENSWAVSVTFLTWNLCRTEWEGKREKNENDIRNLSLCDLKENCWSWVHSHWYYSKLEVALGQLRHEWGTSYEIYTVRALLPWSHIKSNVYGTPCVQP